jgi:ADP-ribose pyrophosphatase
MHERKLMTAPSEPQPSITTLATREVYRNRWLRLREDEILRSNGQKGIYSVVDKDECAIILPIDRRDGEDRIWLVSQFRYTIQQRTLELPQGGWEEAVVDPEELARGELREETGLRAERMAFLGTLWIAYGFARQKQHVYLATGLSQSSTDRDAEEHDLQVHTLSIAEFEQKMLFGEIADASTLAALALSRMWKDRQPA